MTRSTTHVGKGIVSRFDAGLRKPVLLVAAAALLLPLLPLGGEVSAYTREIDGVADAAGAGLTAPSNVNTGHIGRGREESPPGSGTYVYRGEYIWNDAEGDHRTLPENADQEDIVRVRVTSDANYLYFFVRMKDIVQVSGHGAPQIRIAVDRDQTIGRGARDLHINKVGDSDCDTQTAPAAAWEYLIATRFGSNPADPNRLYVLNTSRDHQVHPGHQAAISADNNVIELRVPWSTIGGVPGQGEYADKPVRFTVASLRANQFDGALWYSESQNDVLDVVTNYGAPGSASVTADEIADRSIDYSFDIWFHLDGGGAIEPSPPLVVNEVMWDPAAPEPDKEWIEIYNRTGVAGLPLQGYRLTDAAVLGDSEGLRQFPDAQTIGNADVLVVAAKATAFFTAHGFKPDLESSSTDAEVPDMLTLAPARWVQNSNSALALANAGDEVLLLDPSWTVIDAVTWGGPDPDGRYPGVVDTAVLVADGHTKERRQPAPDSNDGTVDMVENASPTPGCVQPTTNTPPVAVDDAYSTAEDTPLVVPAAGVLANDIDVNCDALTALKVSDPAHGSVTLEADGSFTYTPDGNYNGEDSFTYKANDGAADSNVATVTITVSSQPDDPVITEPDPQEVAEDGSLDILLTASDPDDPEGSGLTWTILTPPEHGDVDFKDGDSAGNSVIVTYTPDEDWSGMDTFEVQVDDGTGRSDTVTVTIDVEPQPDDPVIAGADPLAPGPIDEDGSLDVPLTASDPDDPEGSGLTWTIPTLPGNGVVSFKDGDSAGNSVIVTYIPNPDWSGQDTFVVQVADGTGRSDTVTINVKVEPVNDPPALSLVAPVPAPVFTEGGAAVLIVASATVIDADDANMASATVTLVDRPDGALESLSTETEGTNILASYTPATGVLALSGTDTKEKYALVLGRVAYANTSEDPTAGQRRVEFKVVDDGLAVSEVQQRTLSVVAVNDDPVLSKNLGLTLAEGATAPITRELLEVTDVDDTASQLTYTVAALPANGSVRKSGVALLLGGTFTQDDVDNNGVSYQHDGSETVADSFHFTVSDGAGGAIGDTTFSITVTKVNDPPTMNPVPTQGPILEEGTLEIAYEDLAPYADDVDINPSDVITFELTALTGTLTQDDNEVFVGMHLSAGHIWLWTPNEDDYGMPVDAFRVRAHDGQASSADVQIEVDVVAVNDPPENTVVPSVGGTFHVGELLTANRGVWNDDKDAPNAWVFVDGDFAYQWQRSNTGGDDPSPHNIAGATSLTYLIAHPDNGKYLRVRVTATDHAYGDPPTQSVIAYSPYYLIGNAAPVITLDAQGTPAGATIARTCSEDSEPTAFALELYATDADNQDVLRWRIAEPPAEGTGEADITSGNPGRGPVEFSYTPPAEWDGEARFRIEVADEDAAGNPLGGTDTIQVIVTVTPRNDPPHNTVRPSITGTPHVGNVLTALPGEWDDSTDDPPGTLSYTYEWVRADTQEGANPVVARAYSASANYTPVLQDNLKWLKVNVKALDEMEGEPVQKVEVIADSPFVLVDNAPPTITQGDTATLTTDEDTAKKITLNATDSDGDTIVWRIDTQPAHGAVTFPGLPAGTGPSMEFTYTPSPDYYGSDQFRVKVTDRAGASDLDGVDLITINVIVNAVNDVPSFTKGGNQTVSEDADRQVIAGWAKNISAGPANESDQAVHFIVRNENFNNNFEPPQAGTLFSEEPAVSPDGTLTFRPAPDAFGTATVWVKIRDDGDPQQESLEQSFTITVNEINDAPVVTAPADRVVDEGATLTLELFTFTDVDTKDSHTATINWGDGTPETAGIVDQVAHTVTGSHVYVDNRPEGYTVTVTVTDNGVLEKSGNASLHVTVNNVLPVVVPGPNLTTDEGSVVTLLSSFVDPGAADTHAASVNWGDGTVTEAVNVSEVARTIRPSHVYADDKAGGYTVEVCVWDTQAHDGHDKDCKSLTITVNNVKPQDLDLPDDLTIGEGAELVLAPTTFKDMGIDDRHTATIDWGDGTPLGQGTPDEPDPAGPPGSVDGMIGSFTFAPHVYADNLAHDGVRNVVICINDDSPGPGTCGTMQVQVTNAAPTFAAPFIGPRQEGETVTIPSITFNDKGTADTHKATIDWRDYGAIPYQGAVQDLDVTETPTPAGQQGRTQGQDGTLASIDHVFADNGTYHPRICIYDEGEDNNSVTCHDLTITVTNQVPTVVTAEQNRTVGEGEKVQISIAEFNDKGTLDTHFAEIRWGDGTTSLNGCPASVNTVCVTETPSGPPGSTAGRNIKVAAEHYYAQDTTGKPPYTVSVCLRDDDEVHQECPTFTVTVTNAAPTLAEMAPITVQEGDRVVLPPTLFNDRGTQDTHTARVDWDDGSDESTNGCPESLTRACVGEAPSGPPGNATGTNGEVKAAHVYAEDGQYTVRVYVADDDEERSATMAVTVLNAPPTVAAGSISDVDEGTPISLAPATFHDRGTLDTHRATIDWGDGTEEPGAVTDHASGPPGSESGADGTVAGTHRYQDDSAKQPGGVYTIRVCVVDDEEETCDTTTSRVRNVPPEPAAAIRLPNGQLNAGQIVNGRLTFYVDIQTDVRWTAELSSDKGPYDNENLAYHWQFPGPVDKNEKEFTHEFVSGGIWPSSLTVTDPDGEAVVQYFDVVVQTPCTMAAEIAPEVSGDKLEGSLLTFTGRVTDGNPVRRVNFFWEFGDGQQGTCTVQPNADPRECTVMHAYADNGSPVVSIMVQDDLACTKYPDALPLVIGNVAPQIASGPSVLTPAAEVVEGSPFRLGVGFVDPGTADTHTVSWDCDGDGSFEVVGAEGRCTYRADDEVVGDDCLPCPPGQQQCPCVPEPAHVVKVRVTDKDGDFVEGEVAVTVNNAPPVASTELSVVGYKEGEAVPLTATGWDPGIDPGDLPAAFTYEWKVYENGVVHTFNEQSPSVVFAEDGSYLGQVKVWDGQGAESVLPASTTIVVDNVAPEVMGCFDPTAGATASCAGVGAPDQELLPLDWLSASPQGDAPEWCRRGEKDENGDPLPAGERGTPVASAPELVCLRFVALADDAGAVDREELEFSWDFGDRAVIDFAGPGQNWWAPHTYEHQGVYTVQVFVRDRRGEVTSDSFRIEITPKKPVCQSIEVVGSAVECRRTDVRVHAESPDGGPLWYTFNWGDGSAPVGGISSTVSHTYYQSGTYPLVVRVEDQDGEGDECWLDLEVANAPPVVALSPAQQQEGSMIRMLPEVSDCSGDVPHLVYTWDFGDGSVADTPIGEHVYAEPGDYVVTLLVEDDEPLLPGEVPDPLTMSNVAQAVMHVTNLPPDVTILRPVPASGLEGQCIEYVACAVDPGGQPVEPIIFTWDWNPSAAGDETEDDGTAGPIVECELQDADSDPCDECAGQCSLVRRAYADNRGDDLPYQLYLVVRDPDNEPDLPPDQQGQERGVTLNMAIANVAPRIKQPPEYPQETAFPGSHVQGSVLTYEYHADEPGAEDLLQWELHNAEQGMSIGRGTGLFTWNPGVQQAGRRYTVVVRVRDKDGGIGQFTGSLQVIVGDSDGDDLPDEYEQLFSECLTVGTDDRLSDPDGDGLANVEEFLRDAAGSSSNPCVANTPDAPVVVRPLDGAEEPRGRLLLPQSLDLELVVNRAAHADPVFEQYADLPSLHYQFVVGKNLDRANEDEWQVLYGTAPRGQQWDDDFSMAFCDALVDGLFAAEVSTRISAEALAAAAQEADIPLENAQDLQWRARACDGWAFGPWSAVQTIFYNTANEAPAGPTLTAPLEGAEDLPEQPTLEAQPGGAPEDADLDGVTYHFHVWPMGGVPQQPLVQSPLTSPEDRLNPCHGVERDETDGMARWQVNVPLPDDTWYCWQVWAVDDECLYSEPSEVQCFLVNKINRPPAAPELVSPEPNLAGTRALPAGRDRRPGVTVAEVTSTDGVTLTWKAAKDPDGNELVYTVEYVAQQAWDEQPPGFGEAIVSDPIDLNGQPQGQYVLDGLQDDTFYYWRVLAHEELNFSSQTQVPNVGLFFVNTANDRPQGPEPLAVDSPTSRASLAVTCAEDADRDLLSYSCELREGSEHGKLANQAAGASLPEVVAHAPGSAALGACNADCVCTVTWQVQGLTRNRPYCYRCRACDRSGGCTEDEQWGAWGECQTFRPGGNTCPKPVSRVAPDLHSYFTFDGWPALSVSNAEDPDYHDPSAPLQYVFQIFDTDELDRADPVLEVTVDEDPSGTTTAVLSAEQTETLVQRGKTITFHWRVKVIDPLDDRKSCNPVSEAWDFLVKGRPASPPKPDEGCCGHIASSDPPRTRGEALLFLAVAAGLLRLGKRRRSQG